MPANRSTTAESERGVEQNARSMPKLRLSGTLVIPYILQPRSTQLGDHGFTGGTGSLMAIQEIINWMYTYY